MPLKMDPDAIESEVIAPMEGLKKDVKDKLIHMKTHVGELQDCISGDSADAICESLDNTLTSLGASFENATDMYLQQLRDVVADIRAVDEAMSSSIGV